MRGQCKIGNRAFAPSRPLAIEEETEAGSTCIACLDPTANRKHLSREVAAKVNLVEKVAEVLHDLATKKAWEDDWYFKNREAKPGPFLTDAPEGFRSYKPRLRPNQLLPTFAKALPPDSIRIFTYTMNTWPSVPLWPVKILPWMDDAEITNEMVRTRYYAAMGKLASSSALQPIAEVSKVIQNGPFAAGMPTWEKRTRGPLTRFARPLSEGDFNNLLEERKSKFSAIQNSARDLIRELKGFSQPWPAVTSLNFGPPYSRSKPYVHFGSIIRRRSIRC